MLFNLGLALLFFLPIIESIDRTIALYFLLLGSLFMGIPFILRKKISLDYLDILLLMILVIFTVSTIFSWSVTRSFTELLRYIAYFLVFVGLRNYCYNGNDFRHPDRGHVNGRVEGSLEDSSTSPPAGGFARNDKDFNKRNIIKRFYISMVLVNSLILSILSLLYLIPWFKLPIPSSGMNLFYPVYRHNRIVDLLIFAIPLSIFTISNLDDKRKRVLASFLSIFFIVVFILSMGRAALLSLTFSFFLYFFLHSSCHCEDPEFVEGDEAIPWKCTNSVRDRHAPPKAGLAMTNWITLLGIITIFILSSIFIYSNFVIKEEDKVWQPLRRLYRPIESDFHIDYAVQALKGFSLSPIFGTGLDTFRYISERYKGKDMFSWSWYTHNHFLQMFTETGVFGGLLFMVFIIVVLITAYKNIRYYPGRSEAIFISLLASSIQSLIDFNWQFLSIFLIFWFGNAVLLPGEIGGLFVKPNKNMLFVFFLVIIFLFLFQMMFLYKID